MLWNEFIKLNHVSKLSLNEQMRKFNEHIINGVLNQTQTGAGSKSTLLNPGSTFFIILDNIQPYDAIEFTLRNNGSFVFATNGGDTITSPTFTATASSNYVFRCNGYST